MRAIPVLLGILALLPLGHEAYDQIPSCGEALASTCDGFFNTLGEACIDIGGACGCVSSGGVTCGTGPTRSRTGTRTHSSRWLAGTA